MPETVANLSDLRVCRVDGEPLVFTMEYPQAEYACVMCGGTEGIFGGRAPATVERQLRHDELVEVYERDRAERTGREYVAPAKVGDDGVVAPVCCTCGATPPPGVVLDGDKPAAWYSKEVKGVKAYACSSACIPEGESRLPW